MPRIAYLISDAIEAMAAIPDQGVAAVVTSIPYFAKQEYEEYLTWESYLKLIQDFIIQARRVIMPGGWCCVNIGQVGTSGKDGAYQTLMPERTALMMDDARFLMDAHVIWDKPSPRVGMTFGSYPYPTKFLLTYGHEFIIRGRVPGMRRTDKATKEASKLTIEEWKAWCGSADGRSGGIWYISPVLRTAKGHPAPFPSEIPYRLIRMHTFVGDVVLDPFVGSGTTLEAAAFCGRHALGVDKYECYWPLAELRFSTIDIGALATPACFREPAGAIGYVLDEGGCG